MRYVCAAVEVNASTQRFGRRWPPSETSKRSIPISLPPTPSRVPRLESEPHTTRDLTVPGASIEERIVDWPNGQSYRAEIYDGVRNPFATAFATPSVNPLAEGHGLTVRMSTEWKAKGGVLGALLDRGLRAQNRKAITGVLAGLKHHVEAGDSVAASQRVDTTSVSFD